MLYKVVLNNVFFLIKFLYLKLWQKNSLVFIIVLSSLISQKLGLYVLLHIKVNIYKQILTFFS